MTLPTPVLRAAQDLEFKRQTLEHAQEQVRIKTEALINARNEAMRATTILGEAEQALTKAKNAVLFQEMRMASAGTDLLSALKEAKLFPVLSVTCPTVGKESDHDHDPPSP
jgi:hypothetical protein